MHETPWASQYLTSASRAPGVVLFPMLFMKAGTRGGQGRLAGIPRRTMHTREPRTELGT